MITRMRINHKSRSARSDAAWARFRRVAGRRTEGIELVEGGDVGGDGFGLHGDIGEATKCRRLGRRGLAGHRGWELIGNRLETVGEGRLLGDAACHRV